MPILGGVVTVGVQCTSRQICEGLGGDLPHLLKHLTVGPGLGLDLGVRQYQLLEINNRFLLVLLEGVPFQVDALQAVLDLGDPGLVLAAGHPFFGQLFVGLGRRSLLLLGFLPSSL